MTIIILITMNIAIMTVTVREFYHIFELETVIIFCLSKSLSAG